MSVNNTYTKKKWVKIIAKTKKNKEIEKLIFPIFRFLEPIELVNWFVMDSMCTRVSRGSRYCSSTSTAARWRRLCRWFRRCGGGCCNHSFGGCHDHSIRSWYMFLYHDSTTLRTPLTLTTTHASTILWQWQEVKSEKSKFIIVVFFNLIFLFT